MEQSSPHIQNAPRARLWGALLIGVSFGGLFDGILLHQVLQWHHLLSLVGGETIQDIRTQVLADGVFHLLMYGIACIGLVMMWSGRASFARPESSASLGMALLGFGLWQIADVVLFHWILRIHRIRVDVASPLPWDIGWLLVFGVPALIAAWWLLASNRRGPPALSGRALPGVLTSLVVAAGALSLVPPKNAAATTVVLFAESISAPEAFTAMAESGADIVWAHESGQLAVLGVTPGMSRVPLYRSGAMLISGSFSPCAAWLVNGNPER